MKNGSTVAAFEREFAAYVGARFAIALCNGTATLHTALVANSVRRVVVPPLTMSATTIAALHAGCEVVFGDVDPETWTLKADLESCNLPVSLYGLQVPWCGSADIDDAAQTLRKHSGAAFTSYSFQASKILALGEGGMLVTDSEALATHAREFSSLGYRMRPAQPRIDPDVLKSPTFDRHHSLGWNYRMNDLTAAAGLERLQRYSVPGEEYGPNCDADREKHRRKMAAYLYSKAIDGCSWLTPQHVPEGWTHDYWAFAVACDTPERALNLSAAIVKHGGERPYPAWKLSYQEPAFRHLVAHRQREGFDSAEIGDPLSASWYQTVFGGRPDGVCPVAESLQPRLLQFQTNDLASAEKNATALRIAIEGVG